MARKPQEKISPPRLREILDRVRMKKSDLARMLHVDPSQVTRWFNGATAPESDVLRRMAEILNTSVPYLQGKDEEDARERLANSVAASVGKPEAEIIRAMEVLTPERRRMLADRVMGWIDREAEPLPSKGEEEESLEEMLRSPLPGRRARARSSVDRLARLAGLQQDAGDGLPERPESSPVHREQNAKR